MSHEQSTLERNLIGRRQALCTVAGIASAVAGIGLLGIGTAHANPTEQNTVEQADTVTAEQAARDAEARAKLERETALISALIPADLDMGQWSLVRVHGMRLGAVAVVVRSPAGEVFQLDVLARDPNMPAVGESRHFSVFVANNGNGSEPTDELQARGAKVLGLHLRRTELSGAPLPKLLTFSQRQARHPFGEYSVLG